MPKTTNPNLATKWFDNICGENQKEILIYKTSIVMETEKKATNSPTKQLIKSEKFQEYHYQSKRKLAFLVQKQKLSRKKKLRF